MIEFRNETQLPVSESNLLDVISEARFGFPNPSALQQELHRFQRIVTHDDRIPISGAAIRNWFSTSSRRSFPKRIETFRFLILYLDWLAQNGDVNNEKAFQAAQHFLDGFRDRDHAELSAAGFQNDRADRLKAISGEYQIIRPFTHNSGRYVLEAIAFHNYKYGTNKSLLMYSHNQPDVKYLYRGDIEFVGRGGIGMARRPHEGESGHYTARAIVVQTSPRQKSGSIYPNESCISGIMLRGVNAQLVRRMFTGVPFIGIRVPTGSTNMYSPRVETITSHPTKLVKLGEIILGDIDKRRDSMYKFCENVFRQLQIRKEEGIISNMTLETVPSEILCAIVNKRPINELSYFQTWRNCIKEDLHI